MQAMKKNHRNSIPDSELVQRYLDGDEKSLQELNTRHKEKIFTSIVIFTKDTALAEDLFQELWIKVIKKLHAGKYQEEGVFLAWVMLVSYNLCRDNYRSVKRKPKNIGYEGLEFSYKDTHDNEPNPEGQLLLEEKIHRVQVLLTQLSVDQQEIIYLRHYCDFSFKEIAKITGISINTCLGRMRYTLINLRKIIKEKKITF
jgi:RNA polymerase sigma-70 factor (ECF subfamily)